MIVSWGRTIDYEMGNLMEVFFGKNHVTQISNLTSDTRYYYSIRLVSAYGAVAALQGQTFSTQKPPEGALPLNVISFSVVPDEYSIFLKWQNPPTENFAGVRVVRREQSYPRDPLEGKVVYEGRGTRATDTNTLEGEQYYYTIFVKDKEGNYSSGAVGQGRLLRSRKDAPSMETSTSAPKSIFRREAPWNRFMEMLTLRDFEFRQDGKLIPWNKTSIIIDALKNFEVSIQYEKISGPSRIIIIGLQDTVRDKTVHTFLLRANDRRQAYEGIMSQLGQKGEYNLKIKVLTSKNDEIKILDGVLISKIFFPERIQRIMSGNVLNWLIFILFFVIILFFISYWRNRRRDEIA